MEKELPSVSIIIRTKNERRRVAELLEILQKQDYKGEVEIIAVDNASEDGTAELFHSHNIHVSNIKKGEFTYPKSMNMGVEDSAGELIIMIVGHALPFSRNWISSGVKHFSNPKVAGVFGPPKARKDATWAELFFYGRQYYI